MPIPDHLRDLLVEFEAAQARPITDPALLERMRTEATRWLNAVRMQRQRVTVPLVDPNYPGDEAWRQEIDLHFLLVALTRLRRAVGLTGRVPEVQGSIVERIAAFDTEVPYLTRLRNVAEHFDDYTVERGHDGTVRRHQLQTWALDRDPDNNSPIWLWLGESLDLEAAHTAVTTLYRGFMADVEDYFATGQGESWPAFRPV